MRKSVFLLLGAVLGAALPTIVLVRLARLTFTELRALRVDLLDVRRRMSTARVEPTCDKDEDQRSRVSFHEPGDPERHGAWAEKYRGSGNVLGWLLHGELLDGYAPGGSP